MSVVALAARIPLRYRYLLAGVNIGVLWMIGDGPVWQHAITLTIVLVVGPPVINLLRSKLVEDRGQPRMSLARLSAGKALLVILAMTGTWALEPVVAQPKVVVGLALVVTVAVLGPLLHPRMLVANRRSDQ